MPRKYATQDCLDTHSKHGELSGCPCISQLLSFLISHNGHRINGVTH
jgi:hypothetical protein